MKILLSALACEPGKGSEPEVGFRTMLAAASSHEVWVLTLTQSVPLIRQEIENHEYAARIHLEGLSFGVEDERLNQLSPIGFHRRYDRWQRKLSKRALDLDREINFDIVHHVTLASYWTRAGAAVLSRPLVWGPVGGGVDPPLSLIPELGARGQIAGVARDVGRPIAARLPFVRMTQSKARVALVQNPDTARRLQVQGHVKLLSNALAVELPVAAPRSSRRSNDILFVGRLIPWKAPMLALRTLRHLEHSDAILRFCGNGPEQGRLERMARLWGIADRVRFEGWLPRAQLLDLVGTAGALIHPALHEEAGLCIAEALTLGTPVVCLDYGGPAEVVSHWPATMYARVPPRGREQTARCMARAVDRFLSEPQPIPPTVTHSRTSFREEILAAYERATEDSRHVPSSTPKRHEP
jgi:glycosyltransferase involved in cell wall biosynthesis